MQNDLRNTPVQNRVRMGMKQYETSEVTVVNIGIPQMGFRSKKTPKNCPLCFPMFSHAFLFMLFCSNHQPKKEEKTLGRIHISSSNHQPSVLKSSQNTGKNMKKSLSTAHAALGSRHHDLGLFPSEAPQLFL
jgi:hypothetical protein